MIAYPISRSELIRRITAIAPNWLKNAQTRTRDCLNAGEFVGDSIWSEVKDVFRQLQGDSKCAFCERKLPSGEGGNYEIDVEHFRPKGPVQSWPVPPHLTYIAFGVPPSNNKGYFLLAYELLNYSASCEICNQFLKRSFFPIEGTYRLASRNPRRQSSENPLLIFPVGNHDIDPESAINFIGASPNAFSSDPHIKKRALVTMEFFKLNDVAERASIFLERSEIIITLWRLLIDECSPLLTTTRRNDARDLITAYSSHKAKHTNCARSYVRLFAEDRLKADAIYEAASAFVKSKS